MNIDWSFGMHNCRETKERLTELVLDGVDDRSDELLSAELAACAECRAEFVALNTTLRTTARLSETTAPTERYWNGYHARLRHKLVTAPKASHAETQRREEKLGPLFATLRLCVRSSVRVPVPLVAAIIIACVALTVFALRRTEPPAAQPPFVMHVPVEVPVVQEKVVTRVVYRDRRLPSRNSRRALSGTQTESTFARSRKLSTDDIPSLTGFKPTEEVKLTVIKGGGPNEK
jgi:hypothetical protein